MAKTLKGSLFMQFLRHPRATGAICPSSAALCHALTSHIGLDSARAVAELGPGTGVVTSRILTELKQDASFFAVELNDAVIPAFQAKLPGVTIFHDSASNLRILMERMNLTCLEVIISGLPWASFPDSLQEELLGAIVDVLPAQGRFVTFAYLQGTLLPAGIRFRHRLSHYFSKVDKSPVVWNNIPPAFVYRCTK